MESHIRLAELQMLHR